MIAILAHITHILWFGGLQIPQGRNSFSRLPTANAALKHTVMSRLFRAAITCTWSPRLLGPSIYVAIFTSSCLSRRIVSTIRVEMAQSIEAILQLLTSLYISASNWAFLRISRRICCIVKCQSGHLFHSMHSGQFDTVPITSIEMCKRSRKKRCDRFTTMQNTELEGIVQTI